MNAHRRVHQSGKEVCNCVEFGGRPCLINGDIGKKIYDDEGVHASENFQGFDLPIGESTMAYESPTFCVSHWT